MFVNIRFAIKSEVDYRYPSRAGMQKLYFHNNGNGDRMSIEYIADFRIQKSLFYI